MKASPSLRGWTILIVATLFFSIASSPLAADPSADPLAGLYSAEELYGTPMERCATAPKHVREVLFPAPEGGDPSDCSASSTNPTSAYDPNVLYEIPVVVHILMNSACSQGVISDEMVNSQIEILNEDFLALTGTNGGEGFDGQIRFVLATEDPDGNPTTGITRTCNTTYFNDGGGYFNELNWDPHNYMNIYTNTAGGALGYVPFLPADGGGSQVGSASDRVVVLWDSFGRDAPIGPPYNQGRTGTHEVGHYLGLEHTFSGGCGNATPPGCYSSGDTICDTNSESGPVFSPCQVGASNSCGTVDPSDNYLDYSDDLCMKRFTVEQTRRMRCSLEHYRSDLYNIVTVNPPIFEDGFESGDLSAWTSSGP